MEEKEFRDLLNRSKWGKTSEHEEQILKKFLETKLESNQDISIDNAKQRVLEATIFEIKLRKRKRLLSNAFKYAATIVLLIYGGLKLFQMGFL